MMKKIIVLSIALILLISGCISEKNGDKKETVNEHIPTINLPSGFTFLAVHDTDIEIGNSSRTAIEGVYRTDKEEDVYIQIMETDSPETLMKEYKEMYRDKDYEPFTDIYFNGHRATKVMNYIISDGQPVPKYSLIWTTGNSMFIVGSSTDAQKVINLATATNS